MTRLTFTNEPHYRLKMAAAAKERTVKELVLELVDQKIHELGKKEILPKSKH